jgi:C-terminal processing protease CtpA/Prc
VAQTEVERLATLGRVWGFLKYYHPGVATGRMNWDSVLVASVPGIRGARTSAQFRASISALLDAAGPVPLCESCGDAGPDSLRKNVDFRWLSDTSTFGPGIVQRLANVRANRHQGPSRFVGFRITALFDRDTAYTTPAYPAEGQRLLALFRFWNMARYWFPYMDVNGGDWNAVLPEFAPRMISAKDATEYHMAVMEMTTRLHDAHVGALSDVILATLGGRSPPYETRWLDSQVVVWKLMPAAQDDDQGLRAGDIVTGIDGKPVADLRRERARYVAAGNPAVFERKLVTTILRTNADSVTYTIDRGGTTLTRRVAMPARPTTAVLRPTLPVTELAKVLPGNVGYINMGDINPNQVDSAIAIVGSSSGIVMDVRNYPRGTMYLFARHLNPDARPFVKFTQVDLNYPGQVEWITATPAGSPSGNPSHYRGRIAILVDERTLSHAEFTVMALRTAPENKVIGSQTAGADGNVTTMSLPGGIRAAFTGLGVYYPDGTPTQRIGIVPDILIRPTLAGFRAGRDEVLERAVEYIRTGR